MTLPGPNEVNACASRSWSAAFAQHARLFLAGIVSSLRNAAAFDEIHCTRYGAKADELEIAVGDLTRAMREHPVDVPGAALTGKLCTLLACETEPQLAAVLGVPVSIVLAGRARMYALAERMVAAGRAAEGVGAAGPSPTVAGG